MRPWLADCVAALQERADERAVTLVHEASDTTWPIDADQMARALGNLLINAIQHAPQGSGRVDVRVVIADDRHCRIGVGDNGPGIADEALAMVFEPFHTTRADGSGLGLSIAREIVEAHGGTLRALSRHEAATAAFPSTGAMFLIELPWPAS
jgi:signal transduction histidine kinase